jgi:hypothetical protein
MNDDEWGYFIDVELDPTSNNQNNSNKTNSPIKTHSLSPKKLNVIYEEEIWHRKDDYDYDYDYYYYYKDTNNDAEVVSNQNQNPSENDPSTSTSESASIIIYFVICASFISWTIILL